MGNNCQNITRLPPSILCVAGISNVVGRAELLLDRPQADEARQEVGTAGLVVGPASSGTTERLLANHSASALAVDVEVAGRVAQSLVGKSDSLAILGEHRSRQAIVTGLVNLLADLGEVCLGGIVVAVDDKNRPEELTGKERVIGVRGAVHSGLDIPALGGVVGTTGEQLEFRVILCLVDHLSQLIEGSLMDDRTAEVGKLRHLANLEVLNLGCNTLHELIGDGGSHVGTGCGAALLALEFEGSADGLDDRIPDIGRLVNEVEVLAAGLTDNTGVTAVLALSNTPSNLAIQRAEHSGASSEMEGSKVGVVEDRVGNLAGFTGDELDNVLGQTRLQQDLVNQPVRRNSGGRWLPDNDVAHQSGRASQITSDGGEVERADGIDETFEGTILDAVPNPGSMMGGLLSVQILCILDAESEEVAQLSSRVDLGLPGILALAMHRQGHHIITVLGGNQVGRLQEDASAVGEGGHAPFLPGSQSGVNGGLDLGSSGVGVGRNGGMGGRARLGQVLGSVDL